MRGILLWMLFCSCLVSCDQESRFPDPFYIATRPTFEVVAGPGQYVLEAKCLDGEQLLGGGYYMPDGDRTLQIAVTAAYPSSLTSWTVIFENPDNGAAAHVDGAILGASAYCLTTSDYPIDAIIVSSQTVQNPGSASPSVAVSCPPGAALTGGGFRTGISGSSFSTFNANVLVSAPTMSIGGQANGWQVGLFYLPQDTVPATTVYALCARRNLTAGPLVLETLDLTTLPTGWGWSTTTATCPLNMFTTGGGYSMIGDVLIPRQVSSSVAQSQHTTWQFQSAFGHQTPDYDFRPCDPNANPDCAKSAAFAACVEIPDIPFVKVEILEPADGDCFPPQAESDPTTTPPITFVAEAADEAGAPLSGNSLRWFQDGIPFGTGESFTTTLPSSETGIDFIDIRVTATGMTTSASDEIKICSGTIE